MDTTSVAVWYIVTVGLLGLLTTLALIFFVKLFILVRQAEVVVIERLGRYHRTLEPGLHIRIPFIDAIRTVTWSVVHEEHGKYYRSQKTLGRIDLRETVYDFPRQHVITRDNVTLEINALIYFQIVNPTRAMYEVGNLSEAIEKLGQTTLRNIVGAMDLDETLISRDTINAKMRIVLDEATEKWGVKVNRVELQDIKTPGDVRDAMEQQMRAERHRRAVILEAEGLKQAAILKAEGERESRVLGARGIAEAQVVQAEAEATARLSLAKAEAQALESIADALKGRDAGAYLVAQSYIKSLAQVAEGKQTKLMIVPYEASALTSMTSMVKQVMQAQE
jgi:regulator of protease activity HflC (stomatin/prohibitin superfamily)